jgi:hypothetical protein
MRAYDPGKALISIHIPKSAGTSFTKILRNWFGRDLHLHYFDEANNAKPQKVPLKAGMCIHGHFNKHRGFGVWDYYPNAEQFVTVLREPLELHLSNYFYIKKNARQDRYFRNGSLQNCPWENIDDYLNSTSSFFLFHFPWEISYDNFKEIIERHFVNLGCTEHLQEFVNRLAITLGKKAIKVAKENVSERDENPSPAAIREWKERHWLEYQLYEYVKAKYV